MDGLLVTALLLIIYPLVAYASFVGLLYLMLAPSTTRALRIVSLLSFAMASGLAYYHATHYLHEVGTSVTFSWIRFAQWFSWTSIPLWLLIAVTSSATHTKNFAQKAATILAIISILIQVKVYLDWLKIDQIPIQQFHNIFTLVYGHTPALSNFAFSINEYLWIPPLICAVLISYALLAKKPRTYFLGVAGLSLLFAGGLYYSMHPARL